MKNSILFILAMMVLWSCEKDQYTESMTTDQSALEFRKPNKILICHLNDEGVYVPKLIPEAAWPGHEGHGDYLANADGGCDLNANTFTDSRDGQEYSWVILPDGRKWMAKNLNY